MILYHYTTQAGLLGILQGKCLWATDVKFFNDSKELVYLFDVAERRIQTALEEATVEEAERLESILTHTRFQAGVAGIAGPYVVSFSENRDQLSQWRGYAGGDGYALGFEITPPGPIFTPAEIALVQCRYGSGELAAQVDSALENVMAGKAPEWTPGVTGEKALGHWLSAIAPLYKHEAFKEEAEWRLVVREPFVDNRLSMQFRSGNSTVVPYYAVPFRVEDQQVLALREVVVGPTVDYKLAEAALTDLLKQTDLYDSVSRIRFSEAPFRIA